MGMFSWTTSDTKKSVSNSYSERGTFTVYVLQPNGEHVREDNYEGYGIFDGHDAYELLALHNLGIADRNAGISLAFSGKEIKYPIKIVETPVDYADANPSETCPYQGYFY